MFLISKQIVELYYVLNPYKKIWHKLKILIDSNL